MEFWIKAAQLLASLSFLIILHELGHFIPARIFKTRVEKFYLFFDPWFSLVKKKVGDTVYGIGWLPLGGYVKISGMIDESMDKEQMKKPPQPWEFRSKPTWQRLIIMLGGVTMNVILAMLIYAMMLFTWGERYLPNANLTDGIWVVDSIMYNAGFRNGDKIIAINGERPHKFTDVMENIIYGGSVEVERDGKTEYVAIPENLIEQLTDKKERSLLLYPRVPFIVAEVPDTSINKESGLLPNDKVIGINGRPVKYYDEIKPFLLENKGTTAEFTVEREGKNQIIELAISEKGEIEIMWGRANYSDMARLDLYKLEQIEYGFFESIPAGVAKAIDRLNFYVKQFMLIITPSTGAYKGLGGFGAIGSLFPPTWDWHSFWGTTAFISIILAFMNILPIPALDGGHVMFLLYEMITRRKPSEKFMEYAQISGFVLLMALVLYANGNDIVRAFR